jgi:hypothetical protein
MLLWNICKHLPRQPGVTSQKIHTFNSDSVLRKFKCSKLTRARARNGQPLMLAVIFSKHLCSSDIHVNTTGNYSMFQFVLPELVG